MTETQSQILVIDTSVARAAGSIDAVKPVPKQCREFLSNVYDICHMVGMTHGIEKEWDKHASRFTLLWLTNMVSRGKRKQISSKKSASFRAKISSDKSVQKKREAMEKDAILIEAAMAADGIIVSLDETARELFQDLSLKADELNEICWINPVNESEKPIQWLHVGAQTEKERTFEYRRKKKLTARRKTRRRK